jgi:hypothetical protein
MGAGSSSSDASELPEDVLDLGEFPEGDAAATWDKRNKRAKRATDKKRIFFNTPVGIAGYEYPVARGV